MGFSLKKLVRGVAKIPGVGILASAIPGVGPVVGGLVTAYQTQRASFRPFAEGVPPLPSLPSPWEESAAGGASGAPMIAAAMISPIVRQALIKLAQTLGSSGRSLIGFGRRTWSAITAWVQRNPGTSAIGLLTGLGLTVEEAAHFLAWGATTKRRRRARGISARDLRITRRTTRKLVSMTQTLRELCGAPGIRRTRRWRARPASGGGIINVGN